MEQKAFVTGGTGFIGINLIKLLIQEGWDVTALYRNGSTRKPLSDLPVTWVKGSLLDASSLEKAIPAGTQAIFHLAGDTNMWSKNNAQQTVINVGGTENLVDAAAQHKVPVFIHTSSVAAWGNMSGVVNEKTKQRGCDSWINYERTKYEGERKALEGLEHGMKVVILNPANVMGAHDKNNWGRLFLALRDDELPFIADGCVSVAHVECVAKAHIAAVEQAQPGERYILGGEHHRFLAFVACIDEVSGTDNMPRSIPPFLFRSYARLASGMASLFNKEPALTPELAHLMTRKNVHYESKKAIKELGYVIPPMKESVKHCYNWLKKEELL